MDQYKKGFQEKMKPRYAPDQDGAKVDPFRGAQEALIKSHFVRREREEFFNEAFTDILAELFVTWLKTEPHCIKEREYLYSTAMALGSVKEHLIRIETAAGNAKFMNNQKDTQEDTSENQESNDQ